MRTLRSLLALAAVVALGTLAARFFYGERPHLTHTMGGATMGTTWSLKVSLPQGAPDEWVAAIGDTAQSKLDRIEHLMSTWDSTSELSRFNRSASTSPTPLSPETIEVLAIASEVGERSGGAFDVTVAPLVDAWGFGPRGREQAAPPSSDMLSDLRSLVGLDRLRVDARAGTAAKADPRVVVDLSAIAKGYAMDRAAEGVQRMGATDFALEVGGEVRARGTKPDGSPWRVAVEAPTPGSRTVFHLIDLGNEAAATSGDYRNFYEMDGVRYGHIIDPRSGLPVRWKGYSVTVLHREAARADAWATALSVLGPEEGLRLADSLGLAALFVLPAANGGFVARPTAPMAGRLEP
ncbi:MAG: FAD:protein FMN transferase [Candidatus Palauibacterales bacterium]|nr:FAD:protein FMN transferase [Candidatus Palauibacterales bacterium]MDP2483838.1 FAD:protein FMN transferase [Candidatus Palauibacterales bacterium]